jgi:hypothetical protein
MSSGLSSSVNVRAFERLDLDDRHGVTLVAVASWARCRVAYFSTNHLRGSLT